jgi:putative hemolysin
MPSIAVEILIIFLLVLANGAFSMSELAIVSSRRVRLSQLAEEGDAGARIALELIDAPNRFLSTVQIGITLIGIISGVYGGAALADRLAVLFQANPWLAPYARPLSYGLVVAVITYLSLVVGELVPKRLALANPEGIARAVARTMQGLSRLAGPLVRLLSLSTEVCLRLLRVKASTEPTVTQEEIRVLIEQGTQAGTIAPSEQELLERVFRFGERQAGSLMTPRPDIIWLDVDESEEELRSQLIESPHSRLPLCAGELDQVIGIVEAKRVLEHLLAGRGLDLRALARPVLFVPENVTALRALELFRQAGTAIALVVDEFGGVQGVMTLTDVLEALVGDVELDLVDADNSFVLREDGTWLIDGGLSLDELQHRIDALPELPPGNYQTLGGFVMARLSRIPRVGDHFVWNDFRFEVVDMDGNRVDRVLLTAGSEPPAPPQQLQE